MEKTLTTMVSEALDKPLAEVEHDPNAPRVYVGTYAKYNAGSIDGAWIDLDGHDKETFYEACKELHSDEHDPEYMFQDFENFPRDLYGESWLKDELWTWLELDEHEREIVAEYLTVADLTDFDTIIDRFHGQYDSMLDYAYEYVDSTGMLEECSETVARYFDYEAFARNLGFNMFITDNGFVFANY